MLRFIFLIVLVIFSMPTVIYAQESEPIIISDLAPITVDNVDKLEHIQSFILDREISGTRFLWSADSSILLIATYQGHWIVTTHTMELSSLDLITNPNRLKFIDDTYQIIYSNNDNKLMIYDIITSESEIAPETLRNVYANVSPDGAMRVSVRSITDETNEVYIGMIIQVFDFEDDTKLIEIPVNSPDEFGCTHACWTNVAFSPDNSQLAFTSPFESGFIDLETGDKNLISQAGYAGIVYTPDSSMIATPLGAPGYLTTALRFTDTQTTEILAEFDLGIASISFNTTGNLLAISSWDFDAPNYDASPGYLYIFDVEESIRNQELEPITTFSFIDPPQIQFSPDNRLIVTYSGEFLSLFGVPDNQ